MTANDRLQDEAIRHAIYLTQLSNHEAREVVRFLDTTVRTQLQRTLDGKLPGLSRSLTPWRTKRYKEMLKRVDDIVNLGMKKARGQLADEMLNLAKLESKFVTSSLGKSVPLDVKFLTPSAGLIREAALGKPLGGQLLSEWFDGLAVSTRSRIRQTITSGLIAGEPVNQIAKAVLGGSRDAFAGASDMAAMRRNARSVTRTVVSGVANNAKAATFEANKDIIKEVKWVSTLDSRTTDICMSLDGQTWPVMEAQYPPAHHQCRSTTVPVTKSWAELGIKGASDKRVGGRAFRDVQTGMTGFSSKKLTYGTWLKQQPAAVQDQILGPTRGKLLRSGKVKFDRFFDDGRRLRLDELAKREGLALPTAATTVVKPTPPTPATPQVDLSTPEGIRAEAQRRFAKELDEVLPLQEEIMAARKAMDDSLDWNFYDKVHGRAKRGTATDAELAELNKQVNEYNGLRAKWKELADDYYAKTADLNKRVHDLIAHGDDVGFKMQLDAAEKGTRYLKNRKFRSALNPDASFKAKIDEASEWIGRMMRKGDSSIDSLQQAKVMRARAGQRAFARTGDRRHGDMAVLASDDTTRIFVHEFMHLIEDNFYAMEARAFLKYRSRRNKTIRKGDDFALEAKTVINSKGESGWKDDWLDAYTGRAYLQRAGRSQGVYGTEVMSMLAEELFADPTRLMLRDPEAFDFIVSIFRRVPLRKQKWFKDLPDDFQEWAMSPTFSTQFQF